MANEIERKFLLKSNRMDSFLFKHIDLVLSLSIIEQIYLSEEEDIRIRKRDYYVYGKAGYIKKMYTKYSLTRKIGEGLIRVEETEIINSKIYNMLKNLGVYPPLNKKRLLFESGEELDSYENGMYVMEKEFNSVVDSETYFPWFQDIVELEVTNDTYYKNREIAKRGGKFE